MANAQQPRGDTETVEITAKQSLLLFEAKNLTLSYGGQKILSDLCFQLNKGEIVLLLGDNGAGKTSLLDLISGFGFPSSGEMIYHLRGLSLSSPVQPEKLARLGIGRLWQDIRLFPEMTVLDNVLAATPRFVSRGPLTALRELLKRSKGSDAIAEATKNLALVGMGDRLVSSCDMLSVGQMKRVAIARLFQMGAEIILLDEPLSGLDKDSGASMVNMIRDLGAKYGKAILLVEHRHELARPVADRIWRLHNSALLDECNS
jgi:ABC-type branched-subunit amino acid transport system ATPase component